MPPIALKNEQSRFLFLTLLILYLVARILQLFAGRVPSLLIVILTVIPPALFAVIHGACSYRPRGILVFAGLSLGIGSLFEIAGLRTGFPFGHYWFTNLMGPKVFNLPILLALAYVGMGYLSWVLALMILECQNEPLSGRNVVLVPLLASFVMTAWDFSMDPVWADIDHAWVWRDGANGVTREVWLTPPRTTEPTTSTYPDLCTSLLQDKDMAGAVQLEAAASKPDP